MNIQARNVIVTHTPVLAKVYRFDGKNNKSKIPVKLDEGKHYQLIFICKNREGAASSIQIVCEHDMSRNILKEVGFTSVPVDF